MADVRKLLIAEGLVVVLNYTLSSDDGEVIDSSAADDPMAYLHGADNIVPGLEQVLTGKTVGFKGKVVVEGEVLDAEQHDVFYIPPGKWHCAFNPAENTEVFNLFILQAPRVSDELNELGYVEITKSQWDQLGLPKKEWEKKA